MQTRSWNTQMRTGNTQMRTALECSETERERERERALVVYRNSVSSHYTAKKETC